MGIIQCQDQGGDNPKNVDTNTRHDMGIFFLISTYFVDTLYFILKLKKCLQVSNYLAEVVC